MQQISIIVPLYNKENCIERAINSVFQQTETDWRLIVVDDASTDRGRSIAAGCVQGDSRCHIISRTVPGPGGYAARNLGALEADSEWLAFLDADDEWYPGHLGSLLRLMEGYPESRFLCTARFDKHPSGLLELDRYSRNAPCEGTRYFSLKDYCEIGRRDRNPIQTSAVGITRGLMSEIGGFPEGRCARGGDRDTWLRAVEHAGLAWSPEASVIYHRDAENMVTKTTVNTIAQCCDETIFKLVGKYRTKDPEIVRELKLLSNYEKKNAIRIRLSNGRMAFHELGWLFWGVEPLYCLKTILLCLIPFAVRKTLRSFKHLSKAYLRRSAKKEGA